VYFGSWAPVRQGDFGIEWEMASRIGRIAHGRTSPGLAEYGVFISLLGMGCVVALALLLGGHGIAHVPA
jgi:hypothetical protein